MRIVLDNNLDWLLVHKNLVKNYDSLREIVTYNDYCLFFSGDSEGLKNTGISGNVSIIFSNQFSTEAPPAHEVDYFTMVLFDNNNIQLSIDRLGISKLFYVTSNNRLIASNNLKIINSICKSQPSRMNILRYLLFNYFILGQTYFKEIHYLCRNQRLCINKEGLVELESNEEFYLTSQQYKTYPFNKKISVISEFWQNLINTYSLKSSLSLGLTLTAGFDSRMILAGMLKNSIDPIGFTFGSPRSRDAFMATDIARELKLQHFICPPDHSVFTDFNHHAAKICETSNSLGNFLRGLRLQSATTIRNYTDKLVWGFAGSELIRGLYPDHLMASPFYLEMISSEFQPLTLKKLILQYFNFLKVESNHAEVEEITNYLVNHRSDFEPLNYLLNVIVPLHFGTDLLLFSKQGITSYAPYLNADFIQLLFDLDLLALYKNNYQVKDSHLKRIDNPRVSSAVIKNLNQRLANIELTKGYTPSEYLVSKYYAGFKFLLHKKIKKATYENVFTYDQHYSDLIKNKLGHSNINAISYNNEGLIEDLGKIQIFNEINLTKFTRYLNLMEIEEVYQ